MLKPESINFVKLELRGQILFDSTAQFDSKAERTR
jgi:hypothetical protein